MKIEFKDIRKGDRVRLTKGDESHEFTVTDVRYDNRIVHGDHNVYTASTGWEVERLEKPIVLPTGKHALVAHPNSEGYVAYILVDDAWYRVEPDEQNRLERVTETRVKQAIQAAGLEIVYEGAKVGDA